MSHTPRPAAEDTLHDRVIDWLARHWASPQKYNISTNPDGQQNRWVGSETNQQWPDLIAWVREGTADKAVWIAEVETKTSVNETEAKNQWKAYAALTLPLYLVIPSGSALAAKQVATKAGVTISGYYEFSIVQSKFQLTQA